MVSTSAQLANFYRCLDTEDFFLDEAQDLQVDTDYLSFFVSLLWDLSPQELEYLVKTYLIETPTPEEYEAGIVTKIKESTTSVELPEFSEMLESVDKVIEYNMEYFPPRLEKGVYGKSYFDYCYYDPEAQREFLKSAIFKEYVRSRTWQEFYQRLKELAKTVGVSEGVALSVYYLFAIYNAIKYQTFTLGISVLGRSKMQPEKGKPIRLLIPTHDGRTVEIKVKTVEQALFGFVLGVSVLGTRFLMTDKPHFKKGIVPMVQYVLSKLRKSRDKYIHTAFTFANYEPPEGQLHIEKSYRADQYASLMLLKMQIENIVEAHLSKYNLTTFMLRQYKHAILHLLGLRKKRHGMGWKIWEYMDDERYVNWWLDFWSRKGLNREILKELYEKVKKWIPEWRRIKLKYQSRLKERALLRSLLR